MKVSVRVARYAKLRGRSRKGRIRDSGYIYTREEDKKMIRKNQSPPGLHLATESVMIEVVEEEKKRAGTGLCLYGRRREGGEDLALASLGAAPAPANGADSRLAAFPLPL